MARANILRKRNVIDRILDEPKKLELIFYPTKTLSIISNFTEAKKRLAKKLGKSRLIRITFHTFIHWKATMEYHKTKDLLYVQGVLGHKDVKSTMLYINLENALFQTGRDDEFHAKTAKTVEEASKLIKVGFEFVVECEGVIIFRKHK